MISSGVLEQPGRWRSLTLVVVVLVSVAPAVPLLVTVLDDQSNALQSVFDGGFALAMIRSLMVATAVMLVSLLLGVPSGLLAAFYDFPGRRGLLGLLGIPLLVPSFLCAIGLSEFQIYFRMMPEGILSGATGTTLAFLSSAVPIVVYMTMISARALTKSQIEAVRLAGGEFLVHWYAGRAVLPAATLAAVLAALLTLSDPGPGQILGFAGVPYEILTSFSALYDYTLAAKQCLALTAIVVLISLPVAVLLAPRIAVELLGKDIEPVRLVRNRVASCVALLQFSGTVLFFVALPLIGICRPLLDGFPLARAFQEVTRTIGDTVFYAFSAGVLATVFGFILAIAVGRSIWLRRNAFIWLCLVFALPPSLNALGIVRLGTMAPAGLDFLLRSRIAVGMTSALHFLPIATILLMRTFGTNAPSQTLAAALHGIPVSRYFVRVLLPLLWPTMALSCIIVALLATAEVGTALLLRPPGADSLPVQIFTVMANAPETLVSALCFIYILGAAILLSVGWAIAERSRSA